MYSQPTNTNEGDGNRAINGLGYSPPQPFQTPRYSPKPQKVEHSTKQKSFYSSPWSKRQNNNQYECAQSQYIASSNAEDNTLPLSDTVEAPVVQLEVSMKRENTEYKLFITKNDIKKIHLQLRQAVSTALKTNIRTAKMQSDEMNEKVEGVIKECP